MKKTKLKELTEYLGLVADEETAARVARELDDPASPLGSALRKEAGSVPPGGAAPAPPVEAQEEPGPRPRWGLPFSRRWLATGSVAAALFIGAFLVASLTSRRLVSGREEEVALAEVTPQVPTVMGRPPGKTTVEGAAEYRLESRGDFQLLIRGTLRGYATVILCTPEGTRVYPEPGEPPIQVEPSAVRETPALPLSTKTTVIVLLTASPAADTVRQVFPKDGMRPEEVVKRLGEVQKALAKAGNRLQTLNRMTVNPARDE